MSWPKWFLRFDWFCRKNLQILLSILTVVIDVLAALVYFGV